jgi:hypothetical protein
VTLVPAGALYALAFSAPFGPIAPFVRASSTATTRALPVDLAFSVALWI